VAVYDRREQVDAHKFTAGRLLAAVLRTDPDAQNRPLRRTAVGVAGGIGIAIVVLAGVLIVTFLLGRSGDRWREPGTLILNEDTGSRYMLIGGRLRPVLNHASARLLAKGEPAVETVNSADIADVPEGAPIGIPGAPDTMPLPGIAGQPWTVCAGVADGDPKVSVTVGAATGSRPFSPDEAVLLRNGDQFFLAWNGTRLRITETWVPQALGFDPKKAVSADSTWLNTLPAGPDLGVPPVKRGGAGPTIGGNATTRGEVVVVPEAVGDKYFVVDSDGLIPVSETVATLLTANPASESASPLTLTPAQLAAEKVLAGPAWQAGMPPKPPKALDTGAEVPCVRWQNDHTTLVAAPGPVGAPVSDAVGISRDGRVADAVAVAPGGGMLARTQPAPGQSGVGIYLITEAGAKFPVASSEAAQALGYAVESAEPVPAELLALLPTGPVLDLFEDKKK
jgi:type VII secretion protein EccB